jgi:hypothetical protein
MALGPNLVVNGGFDADTGWTKTGATTITGGYCRIPYNDSSSYQVISITLGSTYQVQYEVLENHYLDAYDFIVSIGGSTSIEDNPQTVGVHTVNLTTILDFPRITFMNVSTHSSRYIRID